MYTGNAILTAENDYMPVCLSSLVEVLRRRKLSVNANKTKVIVGKRESEFDCSMRINDRTLEVACEFLHFGVAINKNDGWKDSW